MSDAPVAAAALAGVPAGVQAQGIWAGRRQLFVRFAGEAETATMYTAIALVREIERQLPRSTRPRLSFRRPTAPTLPLFRTSPGAAAARARRASG